MGKGHASDSRYCLLYIQNMDLSGVLYFLNNFKCLHVTVCLQQEDKNQRKL